MACNRCGECCKYIPIFYTIEVYNQKIKPLAELRGMKFTRIDDIWMGWMWQREAYQRGYCFNLSGPMVRHSRQSNVWRNLRDESRYLEENETLWRKIAQHHRADYESLRQLLPV